MQVLHANSIRCVEMKFSTNYIYFAIMYEIKRKNKLK